MGVPTKSRIGTTASLKAKKAEDHVLLARGLSARYCGANTPLQGLAPEELEKDLRHMEAFENACIAYAQQYYIYHMQDDPLRGGGGTSKKKTAGAAAPMVAMPVRIDPEEEKRLANLRQKIQQSEVQREVLESEYISLRAHYVYLSKTLKTFRGRVHSNFDFLQALLQKRGKLVALQRARLQIAREALACLRYRQSHSGRNLQEGSGDELDLLNVWNSIEEDFKKAEQDCRATKASVEKWEASQVPRIPRGVPLLLSAVAKGPGFCSAWNAGGMFGSNKDTLVYLDPPTTPVRSDDLPALRSEVDFLRRELAAERDMNRDYQSDMIDRRKRNDELVAMMALLRTETEAVVARHNILLESDLAKDAAAKLHEESMNGQYQTKEVVANGTARNNNSESAPVAKTEEDAENYGDDEREEGEEEDGDLAEGGAEKRTLDNGEMTGGSPRSKRRKL